jgi:hypothetical protein
MCAVPVRVGDTARRGETLWLHHIHDLSAWLIAVSTVCWNCHHPRCSHTCDGQYFCHQGFAKAKRVDNVWCKSACSLLRIAQEDMADLLETYPSLLEQLRALHRDRRSDRRRAQRKGSASAMPTAIRPNGDDEIPAVHESSPVATMLEDQQQQQQLQHKQQQQQVNSGSNSDEQHIMQRHPAVGVKVRCGADKVSRHGTLRQGLADGDDIHLWACALPGTKCKLALWC